jgi:PAS domain S-box-containing protein
MASETTWTLLESRPIKALLVVQKRPMSAAAGAMAGQKSYLEWLRDPRLAVHALSSVSAWLWSADGERILWANEAGLAAFTKDRLQTASWFELKPTDTASMEVARLTRTLNLGAAPRLERLRGFGAPFGGLLTCSCSHIALMDETSAFLIVASERTANIPSLGERAQSLLTLLDKPAAIFDTDGKMIEAQEVARQRLQHKTDFNEFGGENLAHKAIANGEANGSIDAGAVSLLRLGTGDATACLMVFDDDTATQNSPSPSTASEVKKNIDTLSQRLPFRFVWQMNDLNYFTEGVEYFARVVGMEAAAILGRTWSEIADKLALDPNGEVASALAARETWSGVVTHWPINGSDERLTIELSALPVFDRERQFTGYRGFAVCRDRDRLETLQQPSETNAIPPSDERQTNIVAFPAQSAPPTLTPCEKNAFHELARELGNRLRKASGELIPNDFPPTKNETQKVSVKAGRTEPLFEEQPILERLPQGILIYRHEHLIYANRAFLDWTGYPNLTALADAGGLDRLFAERDNFTAKDTHEVAGTESPTITTFSGELKPIEGKLFSISWRNESALMLMITAQTSSREDNKTDEENRLLLESENHELKTVLDTATDGVLVIDPSGRIVSANRTAQALFGYDAPVFSEMRFGDLFASDSRHAVLEYFERLSSKRGAHMLDAGREAIGRVRGGGLVPLHIVMGRIEDGDRFCVVLHDMTAWKRTEDDLTKARQEAEKASSAKSEFLAKISHEIRTPLNAIIGFSEVMINERFGPIGNERYRQYLKDIHASGGHLVSLLNDLLDLSKIEAGKLELTFTEVELNSLVQQCVAMMQEEANRDRVIIRTSLGTKLPQVMADVRSIRQIVLNLLSNSIKFTEAGGQVIVSTAVSDKREVVLRVRDTGIGMSERDIQTALEPFRQLATSARWGTSGSGLGLPITKALTEANHARFRIASQPDDGTLVEIAFPPTRVSAP